MGLNERLEAALGEPVKGERGVGGGCIANSRIVTTESGRRVFVKSLSGKDGMFLQEANGLREMAKAKAIHVPTVLHAESDFIVMEVIESGSRPADFMETFGRQFAEMHRLHGESHGFFEDNHIGATPQKNHPRSHDWAEFYWTNRLEYQIKLAERNGYGSAELTKLAAALEKALPGLLEGSEQPPSILHGDLWSGNYMVGANGEPVIIDPATYYGHREADLGMTRLFGGFSEAFYRAYDEAYPLPEGYERRNGLYQLYHLLNHLNLFGTGYYGQSISVMRQYV